MYDPLGLMYQPNIGVANTYTVLHKYRLWQYGLWSFQTGGTKLERFLSKNQQTQRKLLNFENWVSREVSKSAKSPNLLTFKVNFLCQNFFSFKDINLRYFSFREEKNNWFLKTSEAPLTRFSKFNNFLWVCWYS